MTIGLWWADDDAEHIRERSARYPGATDIDPDWTVEAAADSRRIVRNPDPKSKRGHLRVVGYSPSAGFVITVIVDPMNHAGVTAWKTSGADLRAYGAGSEREGGMS